VLSRVNACLLNLAIIACGTFGFIANAESTVQIPGLFIISLLLLVLPGVVVALGWTNHQFTRLESLSFVFIPLIVVNYIFSIKFGVPVGFNDVHANISTYLKMFDSNGAILFQNVESLSYTFMGNWIIYRYLSELCNFDIVTLSLVVPPILNLVLTMTAYVLVSRLCSHKVALLATVLYGWEYTVLVFGHEMRTQTVGGILLFSLISLVLIFATSKRGAASRSESVTILVVLAGLSTVSFVLVFDTTLVLVTLIFAATVASPFLLRQKQPQPLAASWKSVVIFFAFIFFYVAYMTSGFDSAVIALKRQFYLSFAPISGGVGVGNTGVGQTMYGPFLQVATYAIWVVFLLLFIWIARDVLKHRRTLPAIVFSALGSLLLFVLFTSGTGVFESSRVYALAFILIAAILSFGIFKIQRKYAGSKYRLATQVIILAIILLQVVTVAKLPSYVLGELSPIRGQAPIDKVPYWSSDLPQYAAASYLSNSASNQKIYPEILIVNYRLRQVSSANNLTYGLPVTGNPSAKQFSLGTGDLVMLEDQFNGQDYPFRYLLPSSTVFTGSSAIYTNGDYIIFKAP
jgi:hypothetical protein